jgi:hypothetical protein
MLNGNPFSSLLGRYYVTSNYIATNMYFNTLLYLFYAGIPAIVARSMMMKSNADSIYLPLVARTIGSPNLAISATSSEGADFLIVDTSSDDFFSAMSGGINQHVKIPIFSP